MKTLSVTPLDLKVGDTALAHGCTFEVLHIIKEASESPGGAVVACISRLVGEETGNIPKAYFDTKERLVRKGHSWAHALPEGLYWNIQGNASERLSKVIVG